MEDRFSLHLLRQSADDLGLLLADKINFLNPELVIIGGAIPAAVPYYVELVSQVARNNIYEEIAAHTDVVPSTFGREQEAIGATTMLLDQLLIGKRIPQDEFV